MGFWANLLTHKKKRQQQFLDASEKIRSGVLKRLQIRLHARHDEETATILARAVASDIFSEREVAEDIQRYMNSNGKLVRTTIEGLQDDREIRETLTAFFRVIDGIRKHDPKAFKEDFKRPPLENLAEIGLVLEDVSEPLIDDFFAMAEKFSKESDGRRESDWNG